MLKTNYPHVVVNQHGIPVVGDGQVPISQLALEVVLLGLSPQEVQLFLHPHLKMGEIHSALSFFFDKYFDERITVLGRIEKLRAIAASEYPQKAIMSMRILEKNNYQ